MFSTLSTFQRRNQFALLKAQIPQELGNRRAGCVGGWRDSTANIRQPVSPLTLWQHRVIIAFAELMCLLATYDDNVSEGDRRRYANFHITFMNDSSIHITNVSAIEFE